MHHWEAGQPTTLQLDKNSPSTHELAGWLYFQMHDWPAAQPHLLAEVSRQPSVEAIGLSAVRTG